MTSDEAILRTLRLYRTALESGTYIINPVACGDLVKKDHIAELIKRHILSLEDLFHQMFLTSKKTVRNISLMLPDSAQPFLDSQRIRKFPDLLELINTYHNMYSPL